MSHAEALQVWVTLGTAPHDLTTGEAVQGFTDPAGLARAAGACPARSPRENSFTTRSAPAWQRQTCGGTACRAR